MSSSIITPALRPLLDTAGEYRRQCDHFESAIEELLADMEHLRRELEWKAQALSEAETDLAEQRRENQRLLVLIGERATSTSPAGNSKGTHDSVPWSEMQLELAELRRQLFETRDALTAEISRTEAERNTIAAKSDQKIEELQLERSALETELAVARSRAAELHANLARLEQERALERENTQSEIRQLRTLMEHQNTWVRDRMGTAGNEPSAVPAHEQEETKAKPTGDPVVSSVMAQFAKLQKDVAQRRKK